MKIKVYLSGSDSIDAIIYMCGKIGIEIRHNEMHNTYNGSVLQYKIIPHMDVFSKAWDFQICSSYSVNDFLWQQCDAKNALVSFIAIKYFKLVHLNIYITNPFYDAFNILDAHSLYEAYMQIDLVCPENRSSQVFKEIEKKL